MHGSEISETGSSETSQMSGSSKMSSSSSEMSCS